MAQHDHVALAGDRRELVQRGQHEDGRLAHAWQVCPSIIREGGVSSVPRGEKVEKRWRKVGKLEEVRCQTDTPGIKKGAGKLVCGRTGLGLADDVHAQQGLRDALVLHCDMGQGETSLG